MFGHNRVFDRDKKMKNIMQISPNLRCFNALKVLFLALMLLSMILNASSAFCGYSQMTFLPDQYESDDIIDNATYIQLNAFSEQIHNFHKAGDVDWIYFHAVKTDVAIEIEAYDLGDDAEPIITLYGPDELTELDHRNHIYTPPGADEMVNLFSFRPEEDGFYYLRVKNKNGEKYGVKANYRFRIYRPTGPQMGVIDGIITNKETGKYVGGALLTTVATSAISSYDAEGYYFLLCPAGTFTLTIEKTGYEVFKKDLDVGEAERIELSMALTPAYAYNSTYELAQWKKRASDGYYCVDICDPTSGVPFSGFQAVRCGDDFHAWSPKNYVNLVLGIPDSAASGFQFMWKVWSQSGYGGEGFEGIVEIP